MTPASPRRAAVLGGNRIPFARQFGPYAKASNQDMFTAALEGLVARYGLAGERLGGFVLSALDTINTYQNPNATAGEKGLSTIATGMTASLAAMAILGVGGPFGAIFGIGSLVLTIFKGKLGKIGVVNKAFEAIGSAIAPAAEGVKKFFGKLF